MRIVINTGHATDRMAERGWTDAQARAAILEYDMTWPTKSGGTTYVKRFPDGRDLEVWTLLRHTAGGPCIIVKSAAWRGEP